MSVSFIAELSPVYCCLVCAQFGHLLQLNLGNGLVFLALFGGFAPQIAGKDFAMMVHGPEMRIKYSST